MEQGVYPLLLDGERAGELRVSAEGAWTVFRVDCAMRPGIVRVSVYGAGREGYLGVLAPEGERLTLCRRLSPSALRDYPGQIDYAARAGQPAAPPAEPTSSGADAPPSPQGEGSAGAGVPDGPPSEEPASPAGRDAHIAPPKEETPPDASAPVGRDDPGAPPEPEAPPEEKDGPPPGLEDLYWYASPDGALVCFDGTENLVALPLDDPRIPIGGGGWQKTIEGRAYMVFRTKDGRIVS